MTNDKEGVVKAVVEDELSSPIFEQLTKETVQSHVDNGTTHDGALGGDIANNNSANSDIAEIYLDQAQAYRNEQQWKKAVDACREALSVSPSCAEAYKMLGDLQQQQGHVADAMGFYAKALALQPDFPEIYSNLGSLYARQAHWEKAIAYYQKAIAKDASFAPAYLNLARVWKKLDKREEEQKCRLMALKLDPKLGSAREHHDIAQALEEKGKRKEAISFYRTSAMQATGKSPIALSAYKHLTSLLEEEGDWQAAAECYHKVLELNPAAHSAKASSTQTGSSKSLALNGTSMRQTSPLNSSSQLSSLKRPKPSQLSKRASLEQGRPIHNLTGLSKSDQMRIHKLLKASARKEMLLQPAKGARALLSPATKPLQVPAQSAQRLSAKALSKNQYKNHSAQSIAQIKQAIRESPRSAAFYRGLAKALSKNHQTKQSAEAWFRAFLLEPDWPSLTQYFELGQVLESYKNIAAASHCYQRILREKPGASDVRERLDRLRHVQKEKKERSPEQTPAQQLKTQQLKTEQTKTEQLKALASAAHQRGEALRKEGRWEAAIKFYQKAIRLDPSFSWSHHSLGDCYKKTENWVAAAEAYRRAISLSGEFVWSYYSLGETLEQVENWEAAAENYRKVLSIDSENLEVLPRLTHVLQECLRRQPRNTDLYAELAEYYIRQGDVTEAIATYQTAIQVQPYAPKLAKKLATLLQPIDSEKAAALMEQVALSEKPSYSDIALIEELKDLNTVRCILKETNLFDPMYYRAQGIEGNHDELLNHYLYQEGDGNDYRPNPLFDNHYYLSNYPEVRQHGINPLAHYYCFGYKQGYDPHPLFSTQFYQEENPDVASASINPLDHYLGSGAKLGRKAFDPQKLSTVLPKLTTSPHESVFCPEKKSGKSIRLRKKTIGVYTSSQGNHFIAEIAKFVAEALKRAGHRVTQYTEQDAPDNGTQEYWVIAPHEFFDAEDGSHWIENLSQLRQTTLINTEQPQTTWFSKAFHFMRHAKCVLDINPQTAGLLRQLKLRASWMPLGYLENYTSFEAQGSLSNTTHTRSLAPQIRELLPRINSSIEERRIDICFIGTLSSRREDFFARNSSWLSCYQCFLYLPAERTFAENCELTLRTKIAVGISRRSKILLNMHRDEMPYFEWHRIAFHGLWQQTLVVTEPCYDVPGLVPNEHFIVSAAEDMEETIDWLLNTPEGRKKAEKVRISGHKAFVQNFDMVHILQTIEENL